MELGSSYSVYCKDKSEIKEFLTILQNVGGYKWNILGSSPLSISIDCLCNIINVKDKKLSHSEKGTYDYTFSRWKECFLDKTNIQDISELIYVLNFAKETFKNDYDKDAISLVINKLIQLEKYEQLGTVEELKEKLERLEAFEEQYERD